MRKCPDCEKPLEALTVREAQLARCSCGGVWVAYDQLQRVLGREVVSEPLGGQCSRRCPDCTLTMTPMVLTGGVPIEQCSACLGCWLDWPDIVELRVTELEAAVRPATTEAKYGAFVPPEGKPGPSVTGFLCAKCGTRTEFAKGHANPKGLICGSCVAAIQPMPRIPDFIGMLPRIDYVDFDDDD